MEPSLSRNKIQNTLLRWFKKNGRELPWRKTNDPYAVWVSEIMLQQTRVGTVIPYYEKFLKTFPTVKHLAKAPLEKVLKAWEGLGYYSRARNLHRASKTILDRFYGRIPDTSKELLGLAGIGKYTAGAILSIAYNKEVPILDGNVKRVLSRLFAVSGNPVTGKTESLLWNISGTLVPRGKAGLFNQALMDLGAMICTPKEPQCMLCPLHHLCKASAKGNPGRFPTKTIRKRIPHVSAVAAIIQKNGRVLLRQRSPEGLLGGLWEFPNWRLNPEEDFAVKLRNRIRDELDILVRSKGFIGSFKQTYSHFNLTLHVYHFKAVEGAEDGSWVEVRKLHLLPMSRIDRHIAQSISD